MFGCTPVYLSTFLAVLLLPGLLPLPVGSLLLAEPPLPGLEYPALPARLRYLLPIVVSGNGEYVLCKYTHTICFGDIIEESLFHRLEEKDVDNKGMVMSVTCTNSRFSRFRIQIFFVLTAIIAGWNIFSAVPDK